MVTWGGAVESDHIPVVLHISLLPIKVICPPRPVIKKLDENKFHTLLKDNTFEELHWKHISVIDSAIEKITENIIVATTWNCPIKCTMIIKSNDFTYEIKQKFKRLQAAFCAYVYNDNIPLHLINTLKWDVILDITVHQLKQ